MIVDGELLKRYKNIPQVITMIKGDCEIYYPDGQMVECSSDDVVSNLNFYKSKCLPATMTYCILPKQESSGKTKLTLLPIIGSA